MAAELKRCTCKLGKISYAGALNWNENDGQEKCIKVKTKNLICFSSWNENWNFPNGPRTHHEDVWSLRRRSPMMEGSRSSIQFHASYPSMQSTSCLWPHHSLHRWLLCPLNQFACLNSYPTPTACFPIIPLVFVHTHNSVHLYLLQFFSICCELSPLRTPNIWSIGAGIGVRQQQKTKKLINI